MPKPWMAWASRARTCAVEYKAIGKAMRHYTDSSEDVMTDPRAIDFAAAKLELAAQARALGFGQLGVTRIEIPADEQHLLRWLAAGFHGDMDYMERHGVLRSRPAD